MGERFDTVIIGGGFYGLRIAQYLREHLGQEDILILEKEAEVMTRASYNNQARVHNGYHYPRSLLTALRSRVNLPVFTKEYEEAIEKDFDKYYAIARNFSKVSARQFQRFFERIDAEIAPSKEAMEYFDRRFIEQVFLVKEYAFNSATLKQKLLKSLDSLSVDVRVSEAVKSLRREGEGLAVVSDRGVYEAKHVINTTYSALNVINEAAHLPILPLKHELAEMCLVTMPEELKNKAFTVMCGPFFSLMPFPDKGVYTLSHVRYTPHREWHDTDKAGDWYRFMQRHRPVSRFPIMHADVKRYMPLASKISYTGKSLWEIKTVLESSEGDDSRPILYKDNYGGLKNYTCIMGGKIDNIYDVFRELRQTYA